MEKRFYLGLVGKVTKIIMENVSLSPLDWIVTEDNSDISHEFDPKQQHFSILKSEKRTTFPLDFFYYTRWKVLGEEFLSRLGTPTEGKSFLFLKYKFFKFYLTLFLTYIFLDITCIHVL